MENNIISRERLVSVVCGRADKYVNLEKPSMLIPFKGKFPLLEPYQLKSWTKAIQSTKDIKDLSEEFQKIAEKGSKMGLLEEGFKDYLAKNEIKIKDFMNLSNVDKTKKLTDWMDKDCLDITQLKIN